MSKLSLKNKLWIASSLVILIFFYIYIDEAFSTKRKDNLEQEFFSLIDEKTPYKMNTGTKILKGTLGDFFHCLSIRRHIFHIKSKDGESKTYELVFSTGHTIRMSASQGEVYRFMIMKDSEFQSPLEAALQLRRGQNSDSFAVNCDLKLLNID